MAITGRVPLLLLLGLVPVVLRPAIGTMWLWVLVVASWSPARPRARALAASWSPSTRPAVGRVRAGPATRPSRSAGGNAGTRRASAAGPRRVAAVGRGARQPAPAPARAPVTGAVLTTSLRPDPARRAARRPASPLRTAGPLGLAARQSHSRRARAPSGRCRRSSPASTCRRGWPGCASSTAASAVRVRGQGTEFDSLREYVRGDDVRSIDWRATARTRTVVVRTWQPERDRRVVLVLDTSRVSAGAGRRRAAARLRDGGRPAARRARRPGRRPGRRRRRRPPGARAAAAGGRPRRHRDGSRTRWPPSQPEIAEADWTRAGRRGAADSAGSGRSSCLLTPLEPSAVEEGLLPVLPTAGQAPPGRPRLGPRPRARAAGRGRATGSTRCTTQPRPSRPSPARRRTADLLGPSASTSSTSDAESLPPALADHYLELKARGLL